MGLHLRSSLVCSALGVGIFSVLLGLGCSSVPEPKVSWYKFPKRAYLGVPDRPFTKLGQVRTRIGYSTLNFDVEEALLCKNYFNKATQDLVKRAKDVGADAVIDVKSVVFQMDGKTQTFDGPECVDDGAEGQILAQGVAIKWAKKTSGDTGADAATDSDSSEDSATREEVKKSLKPRPAPEPAKVFAPPKRGAPAPKSDPEAAAQGAIQGG